MVLFCFLISKFIILVYMFYFKFFDINGRNMLFNLGMILCINVLSINILKLVFIEESYGIDVIFEFIFLIF